jgi:hypothetical protein
MPKRRFNPPASRAGTTRARAPSPLLESDIFMQDHILTLVFQNTIAEELD